MGVLTSMCQKRDETHVIQAKTQVVTNFEKEDEYDK